MKKISLFINLILLIMMFSAPGNSQPIRLYAGTYTENGQKGLSLFDLNRDEGSFKLLSESDAGTNPSYFCISEKNGLIYAANEVMKFNGHRGGGVTTLRYNAKTQGIEKVKEMAVPNGAPCFISISPGNDYLFMANYTGGSIAVVKLDEKGIPVSLTDTILYEKEEGKVSHAHMISFDPKGKRVYLTDLGLNRIVIYNFDPVTGRLNQIQNGIVKLAKGAGPRHFVFSSDGTKMYVICELNSTISVFDVAENGELALLQTLSTLKEGFKGESFCADIHIGKNGDFLYGSNRGENTIVTFRIGLDGKLTLAGHTDCGGNWPRNFVIDPSGKNLLVANEKSGNISLFRIDEKSGLPLETGKDYKINSPACLKFK
ncbi:MAG: lactonase family protein [Bacteroidota bacterium]